MADSCFPPFDFFWQFFGNELITLHFIFIHPIIIAVKTAIYLEIGSDIHAYAGMTEKEEKTSREFLNDRGRRIRQSFFINLPPSSSPIVPHHHWGENRNLS